MPSVMRSLFKRKGKKAAAAGDDGSHPADVVKHDPRSTPPMASPIDPDGSTASHDSNEIYLSNSNTNQSGSRSWKGSSASGEGTMTASQFKTNSDEEVNQKRNNLPEDSPMAQANVDTANFRSRRTGKDCQTKSREGVPIITSGGADHFSPSAVSSKGNYATEGFYSKKEHKGKDRPKQRPTARCSAFGGAPRYDWMDIETTAAIKIQAAYRRLQTQNDLERRNLTTPGMRNRSAQRRARQQQRMGVQTSADVPFPFSLCGVGLLFGDSTFEDEKIVEDLEKRKVQQRKQGYEREDENMRKFRMRKKESRHLEEGIEVVESFEAGEEEEGSGEEETVQEQSQSRSRRSMRKGKSRRRSGEPSGRHSSEMPDSPGSRSSAGSSYRRKAASRGKSKRLSREMNEFDPNDSDFED